jgi:hypothetical protein
MTTVECPICLDRIVVSGDETYEYEAGEYQQITISPATDPRKRADILRTSYFLCPNPSNDTEKHYLPLALVAETCRRYRRSSRFQEGPYTAGRLTAVRGGGLPGRGWCVGS